jgi:LPLT family lysophospholipid transporter-like MFS transporter
VLKLPDNTQIALLGLWLSVGVMAGSLTAGKLLAVSDLTRTRRYGVLLVGMLLAVFAIEPLGLQHIGQQLLQKAGPGGGQQTVLVILPVVMGLLIGAGFAAGLFLIPLNAALQAESDPNKLGKTIAVQNFCDNLGMVIAGLLVFICVKAHLSASQVFLVLAVLVAAALAWLKFPAVVKEAAKS